MEANHSNLCPHCEVEQAAEARFCSSCGGALPTGWEEPRSFTHDEKAYLGVGFELRQALLAFEVPSGCARQFFAVVLALGLLGAVSMSVALGHPAVQETFPPILLGVLWVEVIAVLGLWVWSRTQPFAAALTFFILYLTGAVFSFFSSLRMLKVVPLFAVITQVVLQVGFLFLVYKVLRSSRNPHGTSKLSTPLAMQPVMLAPAPAALLEDLAARERAEVEESTAVTTPGEEDSTADRSSGWQPHAARAVSVLGALKQRSIELIRTSDDWLPSWIQPLPLRVFQAVIVAVVIYQLNRVVAVISGPRGRFVPFRYAVLFAPIVALADALIGVAISFRLIKGLAKLFGDRVLDRDYWLKYLPHLAVMLAVLALLRIVSIAVAPFSEYARFGSPSGDFFVVLFFDIAMVALCFVGHKLWKNPTFPGRS